MYAAIMKRGTKMQSRMLLKRISLEVPFRSDQMKRPTERKKKAMTKVQQAAHPMATSQRLN
jgi:hypothetical protein